MHASHLADPRLAERASRTPPPPSREEPREFARVAGSPAQIVALSRMVGNRAVAQMVSGSSSGRQLQRVLSEEVRTGELIKIWDDERVVEVNFEGYDEAGKVRFTRRDQSGGGGKPRKGAAAPKRVKPETIAKELAFDHDRKDPEIRREVEQITKAKEEGPEVGEGILERVTELIKGHRDAADLEVEVLPHRVLTVLAEHDVLKTELGSLEDLEAAIDDFTVSELIEALSHTGVKAVQSASSSGSGGGGGDEWKSNHLKKLKATLVKSLGDAGAEGFEKISGESTLHHKISREALGRMLTALKATPTGTPGVAEMWLFIGTIKSQGGQDEETALENWTANIELGVLADKREKGDDPGTGFDGNYPKGAATPRTAQLAEAALIIDRIRPDAPAGQIDWASLAAYLAAAEQKHAAKFGAGALSEPDLSQWTWTGRKYVRDKRKALTTSNA
jgi:hypothetical protein